MLIHSFVISSCFQSVKDIKFESNSQPAIFDNILKQSCFQSVKDIKFESNSQLLVMYFSV